MLFLGKGYHVGIVLAITGSPRCVPMRVYHKITQNCHMYVTLLSSQCFNVTVQHLIFSSILSTVSANKDEWHSFSLHDFIIETK